MYSVFWINYFHCCGDGNESFPFWRSEWYVPYPWLSFAEIPLLLYEICGCIFYFFLTQYISSLPCYIPFCFIAAVKEALRVSSSVHAIEPYHVPLNHSFNSIYVLLHHFAVLGIIILTIYIFEYHPPFPTMDRQDFDEDAFAFIMILVFFAGISTWKKNEGYMKAKYHESEEEDDASTEKTSNANAKPTPSVASSKGSNGSYEEIHLQKNATSRRRGATSNSSIGSKDLVSLLQNKSVRKGDDAASYMGSVGSGESEESSADDALLEDIMTSDNESQTLQSRELFEHRMAGVPTLSPEPDNDVLNIHQTLELKGILILCFLIYQSTNASRAHEHRYHNADEQRDVFNPYYNLNRVGASAFLFMTGFGHTMYFHKQHDYSTRRLLKVMFRMNFAAMFLCLALDKPYIFYKPCAMHTYFFTYVYGTMKWRSKKNYTKLGLRLKMIVTALTLYLVWDCDLGLWPVHAVLFGRSEQQIAGAPYGQLWEFYFQGHLHHWAALIGMLYALNHGVTSLMMRRLEKLGNPVQLMFKSIIGGTITVALLIWWFGPFRTTKYLYNATNAYFGFLPVLWYVFIRNSTVHLRSHHCEMFKTLGQYSLEIYLLHHHFFSSDETGAKIMFLPGYPSCNLIFTLGLLVSASSRLKAVTSVLGSMLLNKSTDKKALWNFLALLGCLGALHSLSVLLDFMGMCNARMVATATIICGMLLYQATMDISAAKVSLKYKTKQTRNPDQIFSQDPSITAAAPPVLGTASIICLCIIWFLFARRGVSNALAPLPPVCGNAANHGNWTRVDGCSDYHKALNFRNVQFKSTENICEDVYQWGWTKNKYSSQCRFRYHEATESQMKLQQKNVVFIGDSVTRSIYFAFCRALGDTTAGQYDFELPLHSEITKSYGDTSIMFQWAPLTSDIADKLKTLKPETDLVIAGSGALDRLHLWATDADRDSYELSVRQLLKDLQFLKDRSANVAWITPTAVNTPALTSEEKRSQMSENNVQEIRQMHEELGINNAAAFVLDGYALTKDQVHRSYDGIHYPLQVYDAGAQILVNSLDWLLPGKGRLPSVNPSFKPRPGSMSNPTLGLVVMCCILIGLFFFDGYLGFSYLASAILQPSSAPSPGRVALFYSSKEEQSRHSFVPQDVYIEVCKAYETRPKKRKDKIPRSELPTTHRSSNVSTTSSRSSLRDDFSNSGTSRRSFGLSTITED